MSNENDVKLTAEDIPGIDLSEPLESHTMQLMVDSLIV